MEMVDPDKLLPGTMVDSFRVVRRLGGGAYGTVYLVEEAGVFYALKMARFREQSGDKRHTHERAQRELNCLLSLHHLYIARVWGHGRWPHRQEGYFYMVMEYVEGGTLAQWREENRATAHEVLVLTDKVLQAVVYMHAQGIRHRDLKPGNILVRKGGKEPVLVDYGVAYFPMPALPQLTDTVLPPGTPRYTSPAALHFEQQNRRNRAARYEYTVADELYALGVTLYDLLTDPQPHSHPQPVPLGIGLMPTPPAHEVNERVPMPLSSFTAKLLAAEPAKRPVSAEAARRDIAELLQLQTEEWMKRPLHPPPQLPSEVLPVAPAPEEVVPAERVADAAAGSARVTSSRSGLPRSRPRARAVAAGAVALGALLACGVYLELRSGAPAQPMPLAAEAPLPQPSPDQSTPTPEKGTPVNTRSVPDASTPSLCSQKQPPPRATLRWKEWCKCAGIAGTVAALQTGCPGAQVRQSPKEECRKEAVEAMRLLDVDFHPERTTGKPMRVQVDLATPTFPKDEHCPNGPCLRPGPITSVVLRGSGKLVRGSLLSGQVFVDKSDPGGSWVLRWTEATLPEGDKHPVCIEGGQSFFEPHFPGFRECPNGGAQICSEILVHVSEQWSFPIIP